MSRAPEAPRLQIKIARDLAAVRLAAGEVRAFLAKQGLGGNDLWACELALVEACNNAVQHGPGPEPIEIEASSDGNEVAIQVRDGNPAFGIPAGLAPPEAERETGRGLFLMQTLMDKVWVERTGPGNRVILRKRAAETGRGGESRGLDKTV